MWKRKFLILTGMRTKFTNELFTIVACGVLWNIIIQLNGEKNHPETASEAAGSDDEDEQQQSMNRSSCSDDELEDTSARTRLITKYFAHL